MGKYRKKPVVINAAQWFENGDHPLDNSDRHIEGFNFPAEGEIVRYFRYPDVAGEMRCKYCDNFMHVHGWIDTL